jgi:uncharacterized membrane protein YphA (DoxX/SURF4 family)
MSNKKVKLGLRILLGLIFFVFGLNGFLQFLPMPPLPDEAGKFFGALMETHYFFPVLKGTEVLCGLLLLSGFAVPVALVILAPISIQIFLFHSILTSGVQNLVFPIIILLLHIAAATGYWDLYAPLFKRKG